MEKEEKHTENTMSAIEGGVFYTLDEIAAALRVSKSTVHGWIRKGHLKVHRFGHDEGRRPCGRGVVTRVSREDFLDFVEKSGKETGR